MTDNEADKVTIRPAGPDDLVRLSLISDATFLETFAGEIAGDALVAHCKEMHAPRYLAKVLEEGAKAWLAELDHAPVGYALLTSPDLDAAQTGDIELKKIYLLSRFQGQASPRACLTRLSRVRRATNGFFWVSKATIIVPSPFTRNRVFPRSTRAASMSAGRFMTISCLRAI